MLAFLLIAVAAAEAHWQALLACPIVSSPGNTAAVGVVIGVRDGYAYLLTANHVAASDRVEVQFTSREVFPRPAWYGDGATVIARWPDPDLALVRFPLARRTPAVLRLAPAGERPRRFPAPAWAIGLDPDGHTIAARSDTIVKKEFVRRKGKEAAFFWRTARPPSPGQSGGPLLDPRGRVIGITVASRGGSGYYAHHDEILAALKRAGYGWLWAP